MTSWITGAGGFIGRHVVAALERRRERVGAIGRGAVCTDGCSIDGDITTETLAHLQELAGSPDVVFHLAGGSSVGRSLDDPAADFASTVGTGAVLLDHLRRCAPEANIVFVSSAAVYGNAHDGPIGHGATVRPLSPYGTHKLMFEQMLAGWGSAFGIRSVSARLFSVYGSGLRKQLLWDLCTRLAANGEVLELGGTGEELRDWGHVTDIAHALVALAPHATPDAPVVNVAEGRGTSIRHVAHLLADAWGGDREIRFTGRQRAGDPERLVSSGEPIGDFSPAFDTSLAAGIADYVDWFRKNA